MGKMDMTRKEWERWERAESSFRAHPRLYRLRLGLLFFEASCITVGLFDTDSGVKRCEHGAQSAECLQRAA